MKKKPILFFIFGVFIFITIAVGLVVLNKTEGKDVETSTNTSQVTENNTTQDDNITKDEPIYATKLTINCARSITIQKNNKVELLSGYIKVEPSEAFSNLTYSILDANGKNTNKLKFSNNILEADSIGKYSIEYKIAKSEKSTLTDRIIINVKAEDENFVTLNKTNLTKNTMYKVSDVFSLPSHADNIEINSNLIKMNNNQLIAKDIGTDLVRITYVSNYVKYYYSFNLKVWPKSEFSIELTNVNGFTVNKVANIGDVFIIGYQINYGEQEHINQSILVETDNSIVYYEITEPVIKVKCLKKGSAKLKIICGEDTSVYLELLINFI